MTRWQRYWFGDGGRLSVAILRIGIAASTLATLAILENPISMHFTTFYRPVGIWMLGGHHAPPQALITSLLVIDRISRSHPRLQANHAG